MKMDFITNPPSHIILTVNGDRIGIIDTIEISKEPVVNETSDNILKKMAISFETLKILNNDSPSFSASRVAFDINRKTTLQ